MGFCSNGDVNPLRWPPGLRRSWIGALLIMAAPGLAWSQTEVVQIGVDARSGWEVVTVRGMVDGERRRLRTKSGESIVVRRVQDELEVKFRDRTTRVALEPSASATSRPLHEAGGITELMAPGDQPSVTAGRAASSRVETRRRAMPSGRRICRTDRAFPSSGTSRGPVGAACESILLDRR